MYDCSSTEEQPCQVLELKINQSINQLNNTGNQLGQELKLFHAHGFIIKLMSFEDFEVSGTDR